MIKTTLDSTTPAIVGPFGGGDVCGALAAA